MANKSSVKDCRSSSEFERAVSRQGGEVRTGGGHNKVYLDGKGPVAVPRHRGDLPTGTRCNIIKALLTLGFFACPLVCGMAIVLELVGR